MRWLVVLAFVSVLAGCGSDRLTSSPPPTPSGASTATTAAPAVTAATATVAPSAHVEGDWTALHWDAPGLTAPYESISDVVGWNGGYVGVGQFQNPGGDTQAAAWYTYDWWSWTRTLLPSPSSGGSSLQRVVALDSGLVAIGSAGAPHCVPPSGEGAVCDPLPIALWTSGDGQSWQREGAPSLLQGVRIGDVASSGSLLLLVGDTGWDRPGIWASSDGRTWEREKLTLDVFAGAHLVGLAAIPGGWVVTGSVGGAEPRCCISTSGDGTPAAWFSADGWSWTRAAVADAGAVPGDEIGRVFVGLNGLAASGARVDGSTGWSSSDGRRWDRLPKPSGYPIQPVAADGVRMIGESYDGGRVAWSISLDGLAWQPLAASGDVSQMPLWSAPGAVADRVFVFPNGIGAVGQNGTTESATWFAEGDAYVARSSPVPVACAADNLQIRGGRMSGGTGTAHGDVYFTNVGSTPCSLSGDPTTIELLRADGSTLPLVPLAPEATPGPPAILIPRLRDGVSLAFNWANWCGPAPGPLRVRITLRAGDTVTGPFDGPPGYDLVPRCDQPSGPSGITLLWSFSGPSAGG